MVKRPYKTVTLTVTDDTTSKEILRFMDNIANDQESYNQGIKDALTIIEKEMSDYDEGDVYDGLKITHQLITKQLKG